MDESGEMSAIKSHPPLNSIWWLQASSQTPVKPLTSRTAWRETPLGEKLFRHFAHYTANFVITALFSIAYEG